MVIPSSASSTGSGIAQRVGKYILGPEIATGGMASVRLGQIKGPGGFCKLVAIKRLHAELAAEPGYANMFAEEARLNSAINSPNVVSMIDVFEHAGELLLVMDYVHGETLAQLLRLARKRGLTVPIAIARRVLCDALQGLHAAHTATAWDGSALGIVHRDVSPQNIMVGTDGTARMLDFGVAKAARGSSLTAPGHIKGKPSYMAPEQVRKLPVDARTDVFAAGVVLWEALTGRRLFTGHSVEQVMSKLLADSPAAIRLERPEIEPALEQVLQTALARAPEQRFPSALHFADALAATGPSASRVEVAAWVRSLAGPSLDKRAELRGELESGTVNIMIPRSHGAAFGWRRWPGQLAERASRWGGALAITSLALTMALACTLMLRRTQSPEPFELASRAATATATTRPAAPCGPATPAEMSSDPSKEPLSALEVVKPPLQPESLRLEPVERGTRVKRRGVRPARKAFDVLGF
jgi:eukaryotic-like serine/threonine-protein kinase